MHTAHTGSGSGVGIPHPVYRFSHFFECYLYLYAADGSASVLDRRVQCRTSATAVQLLLYVQYYESACSSMRTGYVFFGTLVRSRVRGSTQFKNPRTVGIAMALGFLNPVDPIGRVV